MGRKVHTKKIRSREEFLAAKMLGSPTLMKTSTGDVLLNIWKHYCLKKPYLNTEYQSLMLYEIKKRKDNYEKARDNGEVKSL